MGVALAPRRQIPLLRAVFSPSVSDTRELAASRPTLRTRTFAGSSKRADGTNAPRKILVVAVQPAEISEVDMDRHVGGLLRGGPIREIVGDTAILKVADASR